MPYSKKNRTMKKHTNTNISKIVADNIRFYKRRIGGFTGKSAKYTRRSAKTPFLKTNAINNHRGGWRKGFTIKSKSTH